MPTQRFVPDPIESESDLRLPPRPVSAGGERGRVPRPGILGFLGADAPGERCRDDDRGVGRRDQAHEEGEGERPDPGATERVEHDRRGDRGATGHDRAAEGLVDRVVHHAAGRVAELAPVLADAVEDDDGVVQRVADDCLLIRYELEGLTDLRELLLVRVVPSALFEQILGVLIGG